MNEKKKRFRGLHSYFKNGRYLVWTYDREGNLIVHLEIIDDRVAVHKGRVFR